MEAIDALTWQGWFSLGVVAASFALFAFSRYAPDIITSAALTLLLVAGVVSPADGLAGFANEGMLTVAVLYVVVTGLTETGAVAWLVQSLLGRPRSPTAARLRLMAPVAALSAFVNNTPVVAVFLPAVKDWARRHRLELSRLMIPLSFASIAGGTCTLIGTSTNLVVNGLYTASGGPGIGFFELAWVGIPVVVVVFVFLLTAGHWLLPSRTSAADRNRDVRQYTAEMLVPDASPLIGQTIEQAGLRQLPGLFLVEIDRDGQILPAVASSEILRAGDRLVFAGIIDSVLDLQRTRGLLPATDQVFKLGGAREGRCFVEAVLSDSSPMVGYTVREGRFRTRYNAVIIAVNRNGVRLPGKIGEIVLRAGDTLLLESRPSFVEQQRNSRDFLLVSQLGDSHPLNHQRAPLAVAIVLAMVVTVTSGLLSMLEGALLAAGMMLLTGCTDGATARRAPDWQVLVVIATSFGIGAALQDSGAAALLAGGLIGMAEQSPHVALALVFVATSLLTSFATNNVAAVLVFPICLQTAAALGSAVEPFLITLMVAASTSFATPIGYQTNLMVFNLGGYRFADFVRIGVPLTVLVGLVTVFVVPVVWPF
ncbi:MAG: SLC13 family permease [Gammaproteobacteria bacterium]|nr:SLC13 family permease [Gammaproteobacteria bacterium]